MSTDDLCIYLVIFFLVAQAIGIVLAIRHNQKSSTGRREPTSMANQLKLFAEEATDTATKAAPLPKIVRPQRQHRPKKVGPPEQFDVNLADAALDIIAEITEDPEPTKN